MDPEFKSIINSIAYCRNDVHAKDGWYIEGHLASMRIKLKKKINQVKSERMERLISEKGTAVARDGDSSADDLDDDAEDTGAMLHNFFDQLEEEEEFDILEEDD